MIPFVALAVFQASFVAKEAGLSWSFDGAVKPVKGHYELAGKELKGDVHWFLTPKGKYDAEKLYKSDTIRTKEADATKGFTHVRSTTQLAAMPAIQSDQRYTWNGAAIASRCVYTVDRNRAWIVRLWWPASSKVAPALADAFLKSFRRLP